VQSTDENDKKRGTLVYALIYVYNTLLRWLHVFLTPTGPILTPASTPGGSARPPRIACRCTESKHAGRRVSEYQSTEHAHANCKCALAIGFHPWPCPWPASAPQEARSRTISPDINFIDDDSQLALSCNVHQHTHRRTSHALSDFETQSLLPRNSRLVWRI
jgi:hypothetical protein